MQLLAVIFEDHSAENFRPLSWSQPVYELRCGLFNLRERLLEILASAAEDATDRRPTRIGLLPRRLLQALHGPIGVALGGKACQTAAADAGRVLLVNARLGPRWDVLAALWGETLKMRDFAWFDDDGLLACSVGPEMAATLLAAWRRWEAESHDSDCWRSERRPAPRWRPDDCLVGWVSGGKASQAEVWQPGGTVSEAAGGLGAALISQEFDLPAAFSHTWDLMLANGGAIGLDVQKVLMRGRPVSHELFGVRALVTAEAGASCWLGESLFEVAGEADGENGATGAVLLGADRIWRAAGVELAPHVVLDASGGPIVLDRQVRVMPHSHLEGPLYIGPGSLVKAGARIGGETSFGAVCKVAGEVTESLFGDFVNKQHDGFIGHAVIGNWVNLGAGTNCSDLKNNYSPVSVDLGNGFIDTGQRFIGLLMGEHSKSAIGTLFNTGACVGFSCNVFGSGLVRKSLPNFTWGDPTGPVYSAAKAAEVARIVMQRRGVMFTPDHADLFASLARKRARS